MRRQHMLLNTHKQKLGAVLGLFYIDNFFSKKKLRDAAFVELDKFLLVRDDELLDK